MPSAAGTWLSTISTPTPVVNPTRTERGIRSMTRPRRSAPASITITPAANVAASITGTPCWDTSPRTTVMNAAEGPDTWKRDEPKAAARNPPTTPETMPATGCAPEATAKAMHSGSATTATTSPANTLFVESEAIRVFMRISVGSNAAPRGTVVVWKRADQDAAGAGSPANGRCSGRKASRSGS